MGAVISSSYSSTDARKAIKKTNKLDLKKAKKHEINKTWKQKEGKNYGNTIKFIRRN